MAFLLKLSRVNRTTFQTLTGVIKTYGISKEDNDYLRNLFSETIDTMDDEMFDQFPLLYHFHHTRTPPFRLKVKRNLVSRSTLLRTG